MKKIATLLAAWMVFGAVGCMAAIAHLKKINIDFTNPEEARTKATWSEPDKIMVSKDGLGWDSESAASREGWIQTKALALGLSWRPATAIYIGVSIQPPSREIELNSDRKTTPDIGDVYVRYSPDLSHWSSWQALQRFEQQSKDDKKQASRLYYGTIRVANRERLEYRDLKKEYSQLDVPWTSDEEAAVRWILKRAPDFFAKHIPFIGYVELLWEGSFYGGQRIQSFNAEISYSLSGLSLIPRDGKVNYSMDVPWRFKDEKALKVELISPPNAAEPYGINGMRSTPTDETINWITDFPWSFKDAKHLKIESTSPTNGNAPIR